MTDSDKEQGDLQNRAYAGQITMDYGVITTGTDIKFTIQWDDDSNRDGQRPGAVKLVLLADDSPLLKDVLVNGGYGHESYTGSVSVNPGMCEVSPDGNTWTYTFKDFQKYSNGEPIKYTVLAVDDDVEYANCQGYPYSTNGYSADYLNGDDNTGSSTGVVLSRKPAEVKVPFSIVWKDSNNRNGQRPNYVSAELTAYQWNSLSNVWESVGTATQALRVEGGKLVSSDGASPAGTAGGIDPMTADEWTGTFGSRFAFSGGTKVIYHLSVSSDLNEALPGGSPEYSWVETAHGSCVPDGTDDFKLDAVPQVTISQGIVTTSVPALVHWNDVQDNDGIRPRHIVLQLYAHAPGEKPKPVEGTAYRVTLASDPKAGDWNYVFSGVPKYAEGKSGVELIYTVRAEEAGGEPLYGSYVIDSNGEEEEVLRYEASYLKDGGAGDLAGTSDPDESGRPYVKLSHGSETQTMNFSVNWHDGDNRDGVRPASVPAALYKIVGGGEPVYVRAMNITEGDNGTWTQKVQGLPGREGGNTVKYVLQVPEDAQRELAASGYTVTVQDNIVHMYYTPKAGGVSVQLYWSDGDNNDGYRPDSVTATLYANGVPTDKTADLNEANGWSAEWTGLDVYYVDGAKPGVKTAYSVVVEAPDGYEATYEPASTTVGAGEVLYVRLTHEGDVSGVPARSAGTTDPTTTTRGRAP